MTRVNDAMEHVVDIIVNAGADFISRDHAAFARDVFFEWLRTHLNSATCPECFAYLGTQQVPDYTRCSNCGKKIRTIKVTPLKIYLTLKNNADIFNTVPDEIKNHSPVNKLGRNKGLALKIYDSLSLSNIEKPFLVWLKSVRPDLYFTIFMYPLTSDYLYTLNDLVFDKESDAVKTAMEKFECESREELKEKLTRMFELYLTDVEEFANDLQKYGEPKYSAWPTLTMYNLMNGKRNKEEVNKMAEQLKIDYNKEIELIRSEKGAEYAKNVSMAHLIIKKLAREGVTLEGVKTFISQIDSVRIKGRQFISDGV